MAQRKEAGDNYNVASFFMLKLLPPKNGTPALEKKTDKKGRTYLVLHVRDCAGGGTYICNVFNNTGLADRVLAMNNGRGLQEGEMFLATGSFSSYQSGGSTKKALRVTTLISYGEGMKFQPGCIAGDGNDVMYNGVCVRAASQTGEVLGRFTTKQHNSGVRFCVRENTTDSASASFACIAFGHVAEKIAAQRYAEGDILSVRGSLRRLADGREVFKMADVPTVIRRKNEDPKADDEEQEKETTPPSNILADAAAHSSLGSRHFG